MKWKELRERLNKLLAEDLDIKYLAVSAVDTNICLTVDSKSESLCLRDDNC